MSNKIINLLDNIGIIKKEDNIAIKCSSKGLLEQNIKRKKYSARYASEVMLEDRFPVGYIDKTVCGCGLTTVALENKYDTIIAVPTINLLDNKYQQYKDKEDYPYELFIIQGGVSNKDIDKYISRSNTIKIMITYDSLSKVQHLLQDIDSLVIDESQELTNLIDMKASDKTKSIDIITKLYTIAYKHRDKVSFVTATPIPLEYEPDWLSDLDYHKIEWENTIKVKPMLIETTFPIKSLIDKVVSPIKVNGYTELVDSNNKTITIRKAIIFINSISSMLTICKKAGLSPSDVGYIVGESLDNDIRLGKYTRISNPKNLPTFTFVTSCGYSGIDLYDKEALTIIVSNIGKAHTMVDILTDLKQAASRQRDMSNPFINTYLYIYKVNPFSKGLDALKELMESNKEEVVRVLNKINTAISTDIKKYNTNQLSLEEFKKEMNTSISLVSGHNLASKYSILVETDTAVELSLNERLFMADKYKVEQTYAQYQDGFDIQGTVEGITTKTMSEIKLLSYSDLVKKIKSISKSQIQDTLNSYKSMYPDYVDIINQQLDLGILLDYNYTRAIQNIEDSNKKATIYNDIRKSFKLDTVYTLSDIKNILTTLYEKHSISSKPKATYILGIFTVSRTRVASDSKRVEAYKILDYV